MDRPIMNLGDNPSEFLAGQMWPYARWLEAENKRLDDENKRLEDENKSLHSKIDSLRFKAKYPSYEGE